MSATKQDIENLQKNLIGTANNLQTNQVNNFNNLQNNQNGLQKEINTNKETLNTHFGLVSKNIEDIKGLASRVASIEESPLGKWNAPLFTPQTVVAAIRVKSGDPRPITMSDEMMNNIPLKEAIALYLQSFAIPHDQTAEQRRLKANMTLPAVLLAPTLVVDTNEPWRRMLAADPSIANTEAGQLKLKQAMMAGFGCTQTASSPICCNYSFLCAMYNALYTALNSIRQYDEISADWLCKPLSASNPFQPLSQIFGKTEMSDPSQPLIAHVTSVYKALSADGTKKLLFKAGHNGLPQLFTPYSLPGMRDLILSGYVGLTELELQLDQEYLKRCTLSPYCFPDQVVFDPFSHPDGVFDGPNPLDASVSISNHNYGFIPEDKAKEFELVSFRRALDGYEGSWHKLMAYCDVLAMGQFVLDAAETQANLAAHGHTVDLAALQTLVDDPTTALGSDPLTAEQWKYVIYELKPHPVISATVYPSQAGFVANATAINGELFQGPYLVKTQDVKTGSAEANGMPFFDPANGVYANWTQAAIDAVYADSLDWRDGPSIKVGDRVTMGQFVGIAQNAAAQAALQYSPTPGNAPSATVVGAETFENKYFKFQRPYGLQLSTMFCCVSGSFLAARESAFAWADMATHTGVSSAIPDGPLIGKFVGPALSSEPTCLFAHIDADGSTVSYGLGATSGRADVTVTMRETCAGFLVNGVFHIRYKGGINVQQLIIDAAAPAGEKLADGHLPYSQSAIRRLAAYPGVEAGLFNKLLQSATLLDGSTLQQLLAVDPTAALAALGAFTADPAAAVAAAIA